MPCQCQPNDDPVDAIIHVLDQLDRLRQADPALLPDTEVRFIAASLRTKLREAIRAAAQPSLDGASPRHQ